MSNTFQIHGTEVLVRGNSDLTKHVAEYFRLVHKGGVARKETLKLEVHPAEEPPRLPPDAVKAIQGPYVLNYSRGERLFMVSRSGTSMITLDPGSGEAEGLLDRELPEHPAQFFSLLGITFSEMLKYRGLYFLHGACVYGNGRAYLFSGRSRSGKTTAAFNLVRQGFKFVADDSLFLSDQDGAMVVSPFYTNFHVDEKVVGACQEIAGGTKLQDKRRGGVTRIGVNMSEFYPNSFVSSLRPDFVIFPRIISSGNSSFSSLSKLVVYERLLKQTILAVNTQIAREQLRALEGLARQAKGFELLTGPDVYENPKILPALLEQMS
jgi:hypothetical protein